MRSSDLIAEARNHERDQILDRRLAEADDRRLGDEPFGPTRQFAGRAIAPEEIAGLAFRQRQAVAGGKGAFGLGAPEPGEDEDFGKVDEGKARRSADDVLHQERNALGVVDHSDTRSTGGAPDTLASPASIACPPRVAGAD